ncbi:MAG: MarR family transcriptional regulator [Dehalococcoidia bacterium]|jgi:DNA-binding MarR family transcriptional regulator
MRSFTGDGRAMNAALIRTAVREFSRAVLVVDPMRVKLWEHQGLTLPQLRLMHMLLARDHISVGQVAQELRITPASVTGLIDRLVLRALVEREHDPDDHRVVRVALTADGRGLIEELELAASAYLARIFRRMDEASVNRLVDSLQAFVVAANSAEMAATRLEQHE